MFRLTREAKSFDDIKDRLNISDDKKEKTAKIYSPNKEQGKEVYEIDLTDILDNKNELAYKEACENRRFEIQMYWHRAAYFWAFIVAIYTAFFFVSGKDGEGVIYKEIIKLALSFLGFVFCIGFYFSNRGSKVWQENWEIHEGLLEDEAAIKLYKTFHYDETKDYSVSKINDVLCGTLSFFSFVFFIAVLALSIQNWFGNSHFCIKIFLFAFTIFVVLFYLYLAKKQVGGNPFEKKELRFKEADYYG